MSSLTPGVNAEPPKWFGHDAVIWSNANTTYVLVGREQRETLEALAREMEREL
jgi:hypothetical protein